MVDVVLPEEDVDPEVVNALRAVAADAVIEKEAVVGLIADLDAVLADGAEEDAVAHHRVVAGHDEVVLHLAVAGDDEVLHDAVAAVDLDRDVRRAVGGQQGPLARVAAEAHRVELVAGAVDHDAVLTDVLDEDGGREPAARSVLERAVSGEGIDLVPTAYS